MLYGTLLDFLLGLPKVVISGQVLGIDSHFDDFTIRLQLTENVCVDVPSIIYILEVLCLHFLFPISQQDFVL